MISSEVFSYSRQPSVRSTHIGKALDRLCEILDRFIGIAMLYSVLDAMSYMPLKNDLSAFMKSGFRGVELRKDILARNVLVDHSVYSLYLSYNFSESAMQIFGIHTLLHMQTQPLFGQKYCSAANATSLQFILSYTL